MMILVKISIRQKGKERKGKYLEGKMCRGMIRNVKESTSFEKMKQSK